MKTHRWLAVAAALAVVLPGCSASSPSPSASSSSNAPYIIGGFASLTGGGAALGQSWKQAVEIWQKTVIPDGKINGHPVEFLIQDDQSNPDLASQIVTKYATDNKVIALAGATFGNVLEAIRPLLDDRYHLPLMRIVGRYHDEEPLIKWAFSTLIDHTVAATLMIDYAKQQGWTKLAVVSSDDAFGQAMNQIVQKRIAAAGLTLVDNEVVPFTAADSTPQMTKIREAKPDAVVFYAAGTGATTAWKNLKQIGMTAPILLSPAFQDKKVSQAVGSMADGALIITNGIDSCPLARQKLAFDALHAAGVTDVNFIHTAAWTGLDILKASLEKANIDPDPLKVEAERGRLRDQIEKTQNYSGVSGVISYSPTDHIGITPDGYMWGVFKGTTLTALDQSKCGK